MDGETRAYLDQALGSLRQEFVGLRQEVRDTAAETRRHFDVVAESLRRDIQTVAEGVAANIERIDRIEVDLKSEMARGFAATHAVVRAAFRDLRCGID